MNIISLFLRDRQVNGRTVKESCKSLTKLVCCGVFTTEAASQAQQTAGRDYGPETAGGGEADGDGVFSDAGRSIAPFGPDLSVPLAGRRLSAAGDQGMALDPESR